MKEKVIIIGGGVAGLSAGIYAAMNGFDTEILEMHMVAGGQCTAWEVKFHTGKK
jgi:thioredoxin reductase